MAFDIVFTILRASYESFSKVPSRGRGYGEVRPAALSPTFSLQEMAASVTVSRKGCRDRFSTLLSGPILNLSKQMLVFFFLLTLLPVSSLLPADYFLTRFCSSPFLPLSAGPVLAWATYTIFLFLGDSGHDRFPCSVLSDERPHSVLYNPLCACELS